jgi:SPX domain protein involved in polyphosphate accumulation
LFPPGFHKATKKWDKNVPHAPCSQFYVAHLHGMPWVQGNYSTLLVQLSQIYSVLRGDTSGTRNDDSAQGFVRSTTKYWVRHADVSAVKHAILQHLPVFVFAGEGNEEAGDSQLINSAYFDNSSLELYHGRLDKRPGAIAVRIRWYGEGAPKLCFVERKTHRESWKGEESVKERFTLPEPCVVPFLEGKYTVEDAAADLRAKGKSEAEVSKFIALASEVYAQVDAKQLTPTCRTAYWRTAFQV